MRLQNDTRTRLLNDILDEPIQLTRSLAHTLGPGRSALDQAATITRQAALSHSSGSDAPIDLFFGSTLGA